MVVFRNENFQFRIPAEARFPGQPDQRRLTVVGQRCRLGNGGTRDGRGMVQHKIRRPFFGGLPHGGSTVSLDTNLIHYKGLFVIGTTGFAPRHHILSLDLMAAGKIPGDKLVTHILPLDDFAAGVEMAVNGEAMKVVFKISS
jgi:hypothetical protein